MKDSPESKYGDVTGFKPIALSLLGGIVSFCIIAFFIHSGDFRKTLIPNPFQKNISKSVNVLDSITNNSGMAYITDWMTPNCQSISINRQRFDELLSSGVKITTAFEWKQSIPKLNTGGHEYQWVANLNSYDDKCVGQTYILEGPENLLNKL